MSKLYAILLIAVVGCSHSSHPVTPTIGEVCTETLVTSDTIYFRDNMTCVEMHKVEDEGDFKGWTVVYIVGTRAQAVFKDETDARWWAESQTYVRPKWQVR